ncbi:MAG: SAM-dependent methyltransferase [Flavobacteriales bacterium]|jgi:16S rRNA (cytidine1402-2'-O)-methyltransferase|nr:SAM-dependent methyltransferase [Flavobacteriales bacterium]
MIKGKLILIPTVIGENTEKQNIPPIIFNTIKKTNIFIVENIRSARRFIKKIYPAKDIEQTMFYAYGKHDSIDYEQDLLLHILAGEDVGLISEAGTPSVADPGSKIVEYAHNFNIIVTPLVGPSSILLALMASGMNGQNFAFNGYLAIESKERINKIKQLEKLAHTQKQTQIFMETPYRNNQLLEVILKTCRPQSRLCIASNITTEKESILTKTISEWKTIKININKQPSIFLLY